MTSSRKASYEEVQANAEKAVNALTEEQREMLRMAMMTDRQFMEAVKKFEEGEKWEP